MHRIRGLLFGGYPEIPKSQLLYGIYLHKPKTATVRRIVRIGKRKVYDITTLSHSFVANGLVVHNSMATPHVAGLVALMYQAVRERAPWMRLTLERVFEMLEYTAEGPKSNDWGYGVITWERFERWMEESIGVRI